MKPPRLNLQASNAEELCSLLASADIAVPLQTEGRTTSHREQYLMARLLATLAHTDQLTYPLRVEHREKPDFALHFPTESVGVECVEAVSEEWAEIQAIRERDYPDAMIFLPMLQPGKKKFSFAERLAIAKGEKAGPPWVGKMAQNQWAKAQAHFVAEKTAKLRSGNYAEFSHVWLVVQDEWAVPIHRPEDMHEAARLCALELKPSLQAPSFSRIYICANRLLIRVAPDPVQVSAVGDLWN